MSVKSRTAIDIGNVLPREELGAMASIAANLKADWTDDSNTMADVLISSMLTQDALSQLSVYDNLEQSLEKYFRTSNRFLRVYAKKEGINIPEWYLDDDEGMIGTVTYMLDTLGKLKLPSLEIDEESIELSSLVNDPNNFKDMVGAIKRHYKALTKKYAGIARQMDRNLEEQKRRLRKANDAIDQLRDANKSAKKNVQRVRNHRNDPDEVNRYADEAESDMIDVDNHIDSLSDEMSGASDEENDLEENVKALKKRSRRVPGRTPESAQRRESSEYPPIVTKWMDVAADMYPKLKGRESTLFGDTILQQSDIATLLDNKLKDVELLAAFEQFSKEREVHHKTWRAGKDNGGARSKTHYPALTGMWGALQSMTPEKYGDKFLRALTATVFFYDYVVTYSSKTGTSVATLESGLESVQKQESLWDALWASFTGEEDIRKTIGYDFTGLRKYFKGVLEKM